jgi:DNA-binding XRE family transcriptional regulator
MFTKELYVGLLSYLEHFAEVNNYKIDYEQYHTQADAVTPEIVKEFVEGLDRVLLWKYGFEHHDSSPIGEIKRCRLEKNLSMEELGELLGISKQAVLDMETREVQGKISITSLLKALKAMGYKYQYRAIP